MDHDELSNWNENGDDDCVHRSRNKYGSMDLSTIVVDQVISNDCKQDMLDLLSTFYAQLAKSKLDMPTLKEVWLIYDYYRYNQNVRHNVSVYLIGLLNNITVNGIKHPDTAM